MCRRSKSASTSHKNSRVVSFDPPGERNTGNDWVLELDGASKKFAAPGRFMLLQ